MLGHKLGGYLVVEVAFLAHDAVFEHIGIGALQQHFTVVVALDHQVIGAAHVMGCALGDDACIGSHHKAFSLIFDAETDALHVVQGLKGCDFHVHDPERYFLEDGDMTVSDAARDAASLQQLAHHTHRAENAALAPAHRGIQGAHVVLMGMCEQHAFDHVGRYAVALKFGQCLVKCGDVLPFGILFLAVILHRLPDACIDEDTATRGAQVGTVATAAATEADETQSLAYGIAGRARGLVFGGLFCLRCRRVIAVHVE